MSSEPCHLLSEVQHIPTRFKEIILTFVKQHPQEWNTIEKMYAIETTIYDGEISIFPPQTSIFRCFHFFDPEDTRVILIGQDPYHGPGQATGLCFGVSKENKTPPSLRNINKEMENDLGRSLTSTTLDHWAKQGVLMLNAALTVRQGNASSHMKYWLPFTKFITKYLSDNYDNFVYLVWGAFAHRQVEDVVDWNKHHIVISSHPSPLSAMKKYKEHGSFLGSRPFSKVNSILKKVIIW